MDRQWDCIIVGGGAAGLSAALVLGRARRRTLVVDADEQSNRRAHGIGGLLGAEGEPPDRFYDRGRTELRRLPSVEYRIGVVVSAQSGFALQLADGATECGRTMLLATGMDYALPNIAGIEALWGRSVFHCPFCHGWEVRDRPLAVLARGDKAVHSALLLRNWSEDVVVCSDGPSGMTDDQRRLLLGNGIGVEERSIAALVSRDGELDAIEFDVGASLPRSGALVAATMHQRSDLVAQLGAVTASGPLAVDAVVVDAMHRTSTPGLFAAGDLTALMPQVAACVADGSMAAMSVIRSLLAEDVGLPSSEWPRFEPSSHTSG